NVVVRQVTASPVASNGGPYCTSKSIVLSAGTVAGASYFWTGPNGFASFEQNPVIPNAIALNGGMYSVVATVNGCPSAAATTTVVVDDTNCAPPTPVNIVIGKSVDNTHPN